MSTPKVKVTDHATPALRRIHAQLGPGQRRPFMATLGKALERSLKKHFTERENDPTTKRARKGWPKQHFWARKVFAQTRVTSVTAPVSAHRLRPRPCGCSCRPRL